MKPHWCPALLIVAGLLAAGRPLAAQEPQPPPPPPVFRATTDRIAIDVTVVSDKGDVVTGLTAGDFTLTVDGKPRPIVSAEFVRATAAGATPAAPAAGTTFSSNTTAAGGRLVLLAFDLDGIAAGGGRDAARAAMGVVRSSTKRML